MNKKGWNLDSRLRYIISQADRRRSKIAGSVVGPSFMLGIAKREAISDEKAQELYRRFWKNKRWADHCQNMRYELAGI
jgi:hypothetical protein